MIWNLLFGFLVFCIFFLFSSSVFLLLGFLGKKGKLQFRHALLSADEMSCGAAVQVFAKHAEGTVAFIRCNPSRAFVRPEFEYTGIPECSVIKTLYGSSSGCEWGCFGFGSCARVCPQDAIVIKNGTAVVTQACNGCGKCASVCPNSLIEFIPLEADYVIPCAAHGGEKMTDICSAGCTGCAACSRLGSVEGFSVDGSLASIDYRKYGDRSYIAKRCPVQCIVKYQADDMKFARFWRMCSKVIHPTVRPDGN